MKWTFKINLNLIIIAIFIASLSLFPFLIKGEQIPTYLFPLITILWIFNLLTKKHKIKLNSFGLLSLFYFFHVVSFYSSTDIHKSSIILLKLLACIVTFIVISNIHVLYKAKKIDNLIRLFIDTLIIFGGLITTYLIYTYIFKFGSNYIAINLNYPTQEGRNQLALFLLVLSPFAIYRIIEKHILLRDLLIKVFSFIILIGLALTMSRGAWLSLIIAIVIVALLKKNYKIIIALTICFSIIMYFAPENILERWGSIAEVFNSSSSYNIDSSAQIRKNLNQLSIINIKENPILGIGLGNYNQLTSVSGLNNVAVSHNDYLQMATEMGIIVPLIFILFLTRMAMKLLKLSRHIDKKFVNITHALLVLITSISIYLIFINAYYSLLLWVFFGFIECFCSEMKKNILVNQNVV